MPPIDVNRGLARTAKGDMLWDTQDILIETDYGPFQDRVLVPQPQGGVIHRVGPGGMMIYMYNDDPGVYWNERGVKVSEVVAAQAGFDVDTLGKAHRKKLAIEKAQGAVEADFAVLKSARVILERGEYRIVEISKGLHQLQFVEADGTGTPLTVQPLTLKAAEKLLDDMIPQEEAAPAVA